MEMDSDEERDKCAEAFDAIRYNDIERLENVLGDVRSDIIDRNNKDNTLLHYAVEKSNENTVEKLLRSQRKVNIDAKNDVGNTPLHIAALKNNAELVKLLLSNGASSDIENDEGETSLDLATGSEIIGILESWDRISRSYTAIPEFDGQNVDKSSEQDDTYTKKPFTQFLNAEQYELELAMLYLLHGVAGFQDGKVQSFRMVVNMEAAGNVGSLIFKCRYKDLDGNEKSRITFVKIKHEKNVKKEVDAEQLHSVENKKCGCCLSDHYLAYEMVKDLFSRENSEDPIFGGRFEDCEFVIFTNVPFCDDFEGYENHVSRVDVERQSVFDFVNGNRYYKLSMGGDKDDEIRASLRTWRSYLSSSRKPDLGDEIDEYFSKLKLSMDNLMRMNYHS